MNIMNALGKVLIAASLFVTAGLSIAAPVNVNTADAQALAENIKGIGPKKAQAIVEYRQTNGPFKSVEELTNVKGIGLKIIEKNRDDLLLNDVALTKSKKTSKPN